MDSAQISIRSHISRNNHSTPSKIVHHLSKSKFDGESEVSAIDHVYQFLQNFLTNHVIDEAIIGRSFTLTFKGQVRKWFETFPSQHSLQQFLGEFIYAFHNPDYEKLFVELLNLKREFDESYKDYANIFFNICYRFPLKLVTSIFQFP